MDKATVLTVEDMNGLLKQIAEADDPGKPLRNVGIDLASLTEEWEPEHPQYSPPCWNPYEKLLHRVLRAGYDGPEAAGKGIFAVLLFLTDLLGPEQSVIQLLRPLCVRRLLVALMLVFRLQNPD